MSVLEINNLSKNYGRIQALQNVSFQVPEGSIYGILGPNGSGKTTLLGITMNILNATSGSVSMFGKTPDAAMRRHIGTLLETPNFYHYLSGERNLRVTAAIKQKGLEDIDAVLEKVNLHQRKTSRFSTYSLGMKQRLAIAAALLGNPDVLVFDEPTNGLDPVGIAEIRELIKKLAQEGKTIIMASHLLDEVEKVCTHVAILKKGILITAGAVNEVLVNEDILEVNADDRIKLKQALQQLQGYTAITETAEGFQLQYALGTAPAAAVNEFCFNHGITLTHLRLKRKSLEARFLELTNNN